MSILNGKTNAVLLPIISLAICGIINPTQPIIPQILTELETNSVELRIKRIQFVLYLVQDF